MCADCIQGNEENLGGVGDERGVLEIYLHIHQ